VVALDYKSVILSQKNQCHFFHIKRFSCNFRVFPLPRYHRESLRDAHDLVYS
jgi:hypothetical protein